MQEDKELILLLKQDNQQAFGLLYQRDWAKVYNFSRQYLYTKESAEEVVSEVFIKLWDSRLLLDNNSNMKGLLFILTRNIVFNQFRKKINEDAFRTFMLSSVEKSYDLEEQIEANDLRAYINQLVEELSPQRQLVFKMSRNDQKSYKEIASELNITEKTVERHINEALKYLRKNIYILMSFL